MPTIHGVTSEVEDKLKDEEKRANDEGARNFSRMDRQHFEADGGEAMERHCDRTC